MRNAMRYETSCRKLAISSMKSFKILFDVRHDVHLRFLCELWIEFLIIRTWQVWRGEWNPNTSSESHPFDFTPSFPSVKTILTVGSVRYCALPLTIPPQSFPFADHAITRKAADWTARERALYPLHAPSADGRLLWRHLFCPLYSLAAKRRKCFCRFDPTTGRARGRSGRLTCLATCHECVNMNASQSFWFAWVRKRRKRNQKARKRTHIIRCIRFLSARKTEAAKQHNNIELFASSSAKICFKIMK